MKITITDVRVLPGDSGFLLDDGVTSVLYDTGFGFTGYAVADKIRQVLGERQLDYIFLTHSHYDHAMAAPYICARYPGAKVVAGAYAANIFAKTTARAKIWEMDQKFAKRCGVGFYENRSEELRVDIPVADGDVLQAGDMVFRVIALPGHTRCSVGFYMESEKLLLSSETLGVYDGGKTVIPSYLIGYETTLASIARAETLEIDQILLPHYGLLDQEKTAYYLRNCRKSAVKTAEDICAILQKGGTREEAIQHFRDTYYHGKITDVYPEDAMLLNTSIMVDLIGRELLGK